MRSWSFALALLFVAGCESKPGANGVGSIGFSLSLPNGVSVASIDYAIHGPDDFSRDGSFSVSGSGTTFSATVDTLPVADDYTISLDALESDGETHCTGSADFDIERDVVTHVMLRLRCPGHPSGAGGSGSVMIDGEVNVCPVVDSADADPNDNARVFTLVAEASDADQSPGNLSYAWTASAGTLSAAGSSTATLNCPAQGGDVQVTLEVTDTDCSAAQHLTVECASASDVCEEGDPYDPPAPATSQAVTYQINPAHSGAQPNDTLRLPLQPRWTHEFDAEGISYPLAAQGRVYVTVRNAQSYGVRLYALNEETGAVEWGPVQLGGSYWSASAAYEDGRVFALNGSGLVTAYAALTGEQLWVKQLPGEYFVSASPTARAGRVYAAGSNLHALDAATGEILWTAPVGGDHSSPAVSSTGVYLSVACNNADGVTPTCGKSLWHHSGGCSGGGGKNVALIEGEIYTRDYDGNLILDALTGELTGTYGSDRIPAAAHGKIYTLTDGKVWARALGSAVVSWSYGGSLTIAPIVVGQHVVVGASDGTVTVLAESDGSVASSYKLSNPIAAPDEHNVSTPLTGLSAANNRLYVPNGDSLTAF